MNNKPALITIIAIFLLFGGFLIINRSDKPQEATVTATGGSVANNASMAMSIIPADKIEVVNFFGTQRCVSCLTIGKFTKKTLEEKFASELASGKIVFKEINGELPENEAIVMKYQARGSSLFINAIRGEQDSITEDVTVWRLVNSEDQFVAYLEKKLNSLLGK